MTQHNIFAWYKRLVYL